MKKTLSSLLVISAILISSNILAVQTPIKLASDPRIEVVPYSPRNVVPIRGTAFITTQITFGDDEYIQNVQNGDLGAWTASINKNNPNMMFIKPTAYDSNTNMTVVTNKHTYYFHLASAKAQSNQNNVTYAIHFIYPEEQKVMLEKAVQGRQWQQQGELSAFTDPASYNWDYSFHGDRSIVPIHVFDDGKFTFLQLQPHQPVPAIFAITSPSGKESVVNYRQDGQYLIVQQVAPQFTLRLSKDHVASLFNNQLIAKLKSQGYK